MTWFAAAVAAADLLILLIHLIRKDRAGYAADLRLLPLRSVPVRAGPGRNAPRRINSDEKSL